MANGYFVHFPAMKAILFNCLTCTRRHVGIKFDERMVIVIM